MLKIGSIDEFKSSVVAGRGFSKTNLYFVKFPVIAGITGYDLGLFCSQISLPNRQLASIPRRIGITTEEVVYGYVNTPISATFRVLNDQKVRNYFESWQQYILPEYSEEGARYEAKFPDNYMQPLHIYQLERGTSFPLFNKNFDKRLGPININFDLDIDIGTQAIANYHWFIDRAYPSSITSGDFNDASGEITTITVEFQYKSWKGEVVESGKQKASIQTGLNVSLGT